jgi:hypothetical protein
VQFLIQTIVNNFYIITLSMYYKHVIVVPKHVDIKPSEDGQLTETCKDHK